MQETRPEFEKGGNPFVIADAVTDLLQYPLLRIAHLNVGQGRKIVAVVEPIAMCLKDRRERQRAVGVFRKLSCVLLVRANDDTSKLTSPSRLDVSW
jgi:hypothetical protein